MEVETFQYHLTEDKWSVDKFPMLDSENTLVLIFSAPVIFNNPSPITTLSEQYPKATIIGCSTAGEIFDGSIFDKSLSVAVIKFSKTQIVAHKQPVKSLSLIHI